jgi:uncharacterized protein (DUF486 family)
MWTIILLCISNIFMTFAWYGHLKHTDSKLWIAILASWGIAFFEYCFQVPANRIGYTQEHWTMVNLKTIQEVITLSVFAVFAVTYGGERLKWNHAAAAVCLVLAAFFVFYDKR